MKLLPLEGSLLKVSKSNYGLALSNNQLHKFRYRSSKIYATSQKKFYVLRLTSSSIAFSPHYFTINHRHHRTKKRLHDRGHYDRRWICTPILAAISNNIHWYQLQRRDIHHKKRAHLIARSPCLAILQTAQRTRRRCNHKFIVPARPLQLLQITHRPELPLSQGSDTYFAK